MYGSLFAVFVNFVVLIAGYVLHAIVVQKVLKVFDYPKVWFAWVPGLSFYALGDLCTQTTGKVKTVFSIEVPNWVMQFGWVICIACTFIPVAGSLLYAVGFTCWMGTIADFVYYRIEGLNNRLLAIVTGFFSFVFIVKVLSYKLDNTEITALETDCYGYGEVL